MIQQIQNLRRGIDRISSTSVLLLVTFSVVGVLIVTPRPTAPHVLPMPRIDQGHQRRFEQEENVRAREVRDGSLSNNVRAVGESLRRLGLALSQSGAVDQAALDSLRTHARALAENKSDDLLALRALQAELFIQAAHRMESTKQADTDLKELGGTFAKIAAQAWIMPNGRLSLSDDELRLMYRIHWGKMTGLYGAPKFGPSLQELRRYYSTLLRHPQARRGDPQEQLHQRLAYVRALGKIDPDYPAALGEGMLQLQLNRPVLAATAYERFLAKHRSGPWVQIAQNQLRLALQHLGPQDSRR